MSLIDLARTRKRRAVVAGFLGAAAILAANMTVLQAVGVTIGPLWAMIIGYLIYSRMVRTDKYVLWLRRFHQGEPKRLRFNMLLNGACPGLCTPVTIQDSVFKFSYYASGARMLVVWPIVVGLAVLLYVTFLIIILSGMLALQIEPSPAVVIAIFATAALPLIGYGLAVKHYLETRGFVTLKSGEALEHIQSMLQKVARRKLAFFGVLIFKCPDDVWQRVVSLAIAHASAVIIDVSHLTENVLWELKTALEKRRARSILLAFGVSRDCREELPPTVSGELGKVIGPEHLRELRVFYYPAEQPPPGPSRGRLYTNLLRKLSAEIAACLEADARQPPPVEPAKAPAST